MTDQMYEARRAQVDGAATALAAVEHLAGLPIDAEQLATIDRDDLDDLDDLAQLVDDTDTMEWIGDHVDELAENDGDPVGTWLAGALEVETRGQLKWTVVLTTGGPHLEVVFDGNGTGLVRCAWGLGGWTERRVQADTVTDRLVELFGGDCR